MSNSAAIAADSQVRFSLADLFRFVTVVAVLLGCTPFTGVPAGVLLATMALALATRQGLCAVFLCLAALIGANATHAEAAPVQLGSAFCLGLLVLGWYRLERFWKDGV